MKSSFFYGLSLCGVSHDDRSIPCQDFFRCEYIDDTWSVLAIADGVGSAKYAEYGSRIAVDTAVGVCIDCFPYYKNVQSLKILLYMAFNKALAEISRIAEKNNAELEDYDTTLIVVLFNGKNVIYANVGDSGLIGLTSAGYYEPITKAQKGEDGQSVIPLRFGPSYWHIAGSDEEYAALLLATDGLLEHLFMPKIFKFQEQKLYIKELRKLMDKNFNAVNEENVVIFQEQLKSLYENNESYKYITQDDKTVVVVLSNEINAEILPEEYYCEPNWEKLKEIKEQKLYSKIKAEEIVEPADSSVTGAEEVVEPADSSVTGAEEIVEPADSSVTGAEEVVEPADSSVTGAEEVVEPADSSVTGAENSIKKKYLTKDNNLSNVEEIKGNNEKSILKKILKVIFD